MKHDREIQGEGAREEDAAEQDALARLQGDPGVRAPPVAVSLDPHRLREIVEAIPPTLGMTPDPWPSDEQMDGFVERLGAELARLRGEAVPENDLPTAEDVRGILCNEEDVALETARDILDQSICECGHTDGEHAGRRETVNSPPDGECHGNAGDGNCDCQQFRGVEFTVARLRAPSEERP